jgi:type I restriction enzyme, S subunit
VTSNYDLKPLTQVCEVLSGGTPKTTVPEFWNGNIPWASVKDFNIDSRWFSKTEKSISQLGLDSCSSVLLEPGDLVISARGTVGVVGQCKMRTSFNQSNYGLRAKSALSKNDYLYYALSYAKRALIGDTHGGMFDTITRDTLDRLLIPVPTLKVQEQIAEILGSLDMKIAVNNALSKTLESIAQTIFKSWFIDFDPVKAKMAGEKPAGMDAATAALFPDSMEESELGIVPSGWKVTKLSSSLKLHKSTVKAGASTESVPYVPVDQIGAKDIFLKNSMPGSAAKTSLVSFRKNDILFGAMRPYFHKVVLAPFDGTTRTTTFVLRVINSNYLSHSLFTVNQENAVAFATNNSQGTTIPYAVWNNSFEDFPMVLPPEPTAKAFNDLVLPIIEYGYSLIAQNRSLVEIRNGLLPRLISGELQIPDEMLAS